MAPQQRSGAAAVPSLALLVLPVRIELTTSPLPRGCSTTELRQRGPGDTVPLPLSLPELYLQWGWGVSVGSRLCERSEAIQFLSVLDCFVACAPRNDGTHPN